MSAVALFYCFCGIGSAYATYDAFEDSDYLVSLGVALVAFLFWPVLLGVHLMRRL